MARERENGRVPWTRRVFVRDSILGWIGLVIGPAAYSILRRQSHSRKAASEVTKEVGTIDDFKPRQAKEVSLGGKKVLVARLESGGWVAVSAICTHMGCSVRLERVGSDDMILCNCHNSSFALDGTNLSGPAPYPLARYDIDATAGKVMLTARELGNEEAPE